MTCFSDEEEQAVGKVDAVPQLIETEMRKRGANITVGGCPGSYVAQ